jgi:hypothetical protein
MIYPLYLVNADQPSASGLIEKSVRHWIGKPEELMGYSFTGASSMMAALGKGDEALTYLEGLNSFLQPNTMYIEGVTSPCLETPLSAAQSIHDMLLQCWGGPESEFEDGASMIRVFPAVPSSWPDVRFHDLRAEGAFLISASRRGGVTEWVRIKSLAGEPCRIRPSLAGEPKILGNPTIGIKPLGTGAYELSLKKGEEVVLYTGPKEPHIVIEPLPRDPARSNSFGLR